jgi:hypothetical protein
MQQYYICWMDAGSKKRSNILLVQNGTHPILHSADSFNPISCSVLLLSPLVNATDVKERIDAANSELCLNSNNKLINEDSKIFTCINISFNASVCSTYCN